MITAIKDGCPDDVPNGIYWTTLSLSHGHFWNEIQGDTPWWINYTLGTRNDPDFSKRLKVEEKLHNAIDIDWIWTRGLCPKREWRKNQAIISTAKGDWSVNVAPSPWGEGNLYRARVKLEKPPQDGYHFPSMDTTRNIINMAELIQTKEDVEYYVDVKKAEELIDEGQLDWFEALVKRFRDEYFFLLYVATPFTQLDHLIGSQNVLTMLIKNPKLIHQLLDAYANKNIEKMRACAKIYGDREGIGSHNWEWYTDLILSPKQWEIFGKPYIGKVVKAAKQLGIQYMQTVSGAGMQWEEGLKHMLSLKPDMFHLEEEMKGVKTDIAWQADFLKNEGHQNDVALTGNINTLSLIHEAPLDEVAKEVKRQITIGREYGKFFMMTGAVIAEETSLERVQTYCRLVRKYGRMK